MTSASNDIAAMDHRAIGVELFNETWTLLALADRTVDQDDAMVHLAHASAHHWRRSGAGSTANNFARSEWLVSRVYAVLGRAEPAEHHARRCLQLCLDNGIGDWDLAYAYEALARAAGIAGDPQAASWAEQAQAALAGIADPADRAQVVSDLQTLPSLP